MTRKNNKGKGKTIKEQQLLEFNIRNYIKSTITSKAKFPYCLIEPTPKDYEMFESNYIVLTGITTCYDTCNSTTRIFY